MSKTFAERLREDRRLVLLRVLAESVQNMANSSVLAMALGHWGHAVSRDQVRTELAWLAEQSLVTVESLTDGVDLARLTARGQDVADGAATVPGVSRPRAT